MIYFIFGEDSYRSKRKLEEIIEEYKRVHKSGLNLIYIDIGEEKNYNDFYSNLKITSMFAEKKLIILRNVFTDAKFQEDFIENIKKLEESKDIIIIYENKASDKRTKLFKNLQKYAKCQEFDSLKGASLKKWISLEFDKNKVKINNEALDFLSAVGGSNLWEMANEINKLSNYKADSTIKKEDVELMARPAIENDIFKTIDAIASKDKKQAILLLHKHIENGDNALYLLSMISYQFRNLLTIKELQDTQVSYGSLAKKSGLHPFVVQKTSYMCSRFSIQDLKKIYRKIFQIDLDIKTGKIDAETALDLFVAES